MAVREQLCACFDCQQVRLVEVCARSMKRTSFSPFACEVAGVALCSSRGGCCSSTSGWMRGELALQVVCSGVAWLVDRQLDRGEQTPALAARRLGDRDALGGQIRQRLLDVVAH